MITHAKVSEKVDGGDATLVRPSDWNANHVVEAPYFLPRIVTVILTDDDIKALPSTAFEILPTPAAGTSYLVLASALYHPEWAQSYGGLAAGYPSLIELWSGSEASVLFRSFGFLNNATESIMRSPIGTSIGVGDYVGSLVAPAASNPSENLYLFMDNDTTSDLTGGNPSNVLKVTVVYVVIDL